MIDGPWAQALVVVFGTLLGAIFGSFVGAAVVRLPTGHSPLSGRSRCDGCGRVLRPAELVPIASFAWLGGRCRGCGHPIDRWQPVAEVGGAVIGGLSAWLAASLAGVAVAMVLGMQLLLLALLDARHLWLPDRLVLLLAASGVAAGLLRHGPTPAMATEVVAGGLVGFLLLWIPAQLYRRWRGRDGMGGGDPKLLGALGLWLGPMGVVITLLGASLAGLALAAAMAVSGRAVGGETEIPFGTMLALTGWIVWLGLNGGAQWT